MKVFCRALESKLSAEQLKSFSQFHIQLIRRNHKEFGNKWANRVKKSTPASPEHGTWMLSWAGDLQLHWDMVTCCIQAAEIFTYRPADSPAGSRLSHFTHQDWATGRFGLPNNRIPPSLSRSFNWQKSTSLFPASNSCPKFDRKSFNSISCHRFFPHSVNMRLSEESSLSCNLNRSFLSHQIPR